LFADTACGPTGFLTIESSEDRIVWRPVQGSAGIVTPVDRIVRAVPIIVGVERWRVAIGSTAH
jgi:hypothetical protein